MGWSPVLLCLLVLTVLASAKEFVLEDLIAEEDNPDNRRVIHNVGDDVDQSRSKKAIRQSRLEDTIRTVQEPITGPGHNKQEPDQSSAVKDKGGGKKEEQQDDEDRKTLAQQVADGKYGLIQTEIFSSKPKRPGIISYEVNPEVPKDNVNNLGGLQPEEIWLAENHLLVLAGGGFKDKNIARPFWPPIDNYIAPSRQVKIPPNPKVPPPFPVQLTPGGPVEFIKNENGTGGPPPFLPPEGQFTPDFSSGNFSLGNGPYPPLPFPFFPQQNGSLFLPPPGFLPPIPPGAAFLPPPGNLTDQYDEDDPSIYYPPPYDFYFPKDNTSLVPPGPLVPGIVLPPPPDFFAPFTNSTSKPTRPLSRPVSRPISKAKTPIRKPNKHKNIQIITSTEEPYNGFTIRPNIGNVNIVTTTLPPVTYATSTVPPQIPTEIYTRRPTIKTTTDSSLNEVTPVTPPTIVHALPPNAVIKGWVPIPAPRPYYITGARKPGRKGTTTTLPPDYNSVTLHEDHGYAYNVPDYELSVNGWVYPNKSKHYDHEQQYVKVITESPLKQDFYYDDFFLNKNQYYTSTQPPIGFEDQTRLKSIYYPTRSPSTTISPAQLYQSHLENRGKALKTFYFYEEPHISEGKLTDTDNLPYPTPSPQSFTERNPHIISEELYVNSAAKQSAQGRFKPSPLDYFFPQDQYVGLGSQATSTESPLQYYYVPEGANNYRVPPYAPAVPTTPKPNISTKPPVYEYSFSIPGYGSIDAPKVALPKPEQYDSSVEYQTTTKPYAEHVYTTPAPTTTPSPSYRNQHRGETQYYTTQRAKSLYYTTPKPQVQAAVQTENPYHAFFTHQDVDLIDDITKKYFTTFGQKINKDSIHGEALTTPLPPSLVEDGPVKSYYPQTSPKPQYFETDRPRSPPRYSQNSAPLASPGYFTTIAPPIKNYPSRIQYPRPIYSQFYDQRPHPSVVSTQKPIPLGSDILVNYKDPLPPINPDAEFINPSHSSLTKPDQSYISYRLPGNGGGHFFFLTPQVVQQRQQFSDYVYNAEQSANYYNRNTRRPHSHHRRTIHARTS